MGRIEKFGLYLTLFLMGLFLVFIFFSTHGIRDYRQLNRQKASVSAQIDIVKQENQRIENQILRLKQDIEYIRHLAKHEQGMAAPDELIFKQKNK
ncbi:FtsB family cell division protein [Desulfotignum phosphitoxidans]|jgi:cell division protein FtsB|uniref:Virulence factor MviN n=1 Tax=Desulfotignum phosphitoxidans DSM 13687 TaxID=1286635 RepID=S0G733_9BACT|nr:septum formation initiator family protein [Desulfotignum phosphitoxidans]EMS80812.1 virulence factor MviN [Desulfotignum phosphitoxidans DSM 13687]